MCFTQLFTSPIIITINWNRFPSFYEFGVREIHEKHVLGDKTMKIICQVKVVEVSKISNFDSVSVSDTPTA